MSGLTYNKLNYMIRREDNRICGRNERKKFYNFQLSERWAIIFIDHCFQSRMHMVHLATGSNICYLHPKWNHSFVLHLDIVENIILQHKIKLSSYIHRPSLAGQILLTFDRYNFLLVYAVINIHKNLFVLIDISR